MSFPKPFGRIAAALCSVSLIAGGAYADDSPVERSPFLPRTFDAAVKNGETIGWEQVRRVFMSCGTNEFLSAVPQGLRVEIATDKVTLVSTDATYFLTFRILDKAVTDPNLTRLDSYRQLALNQFPDSKVLEEFSQTAAGRRGPAFELRWTAAGASERVSRMAFIPSAAGILEFSLNADLKKSAAGQSAFTLLLRTFRSIEDGKVEIIRGPETS